MHRRRNVFPLCILSTASLFLAFPIYSQAVPDLITSTIDDQVRVTLAGNRHPLARPEFEAGVTAPGYPMERMILTLRADPERERALEALIADQQDPHSPEYHHWLTPEEFGQKFGVSDRDLARITGWLRSHGLAVEQIAKGRRSLLFSGTAEQVNAAFHAQMRTYNVGGEVHHANSRDAEIPRALAGVVGGVVALHDFRSKPALAFVKPVALPQMTTTSGAHYLAPADYATIYDVAPLYQNSINGTGQSIAVVARCNIHPSDVQSFRNYFGLPANNPTIVVNGTDPGIVSNGEETEADLDAEWAGALARNATVQFVVSASTNSSDGVLLSAEYIVNNNLAPVMTLSFGLCESAEGLAGNSFINQLWQQAAAEGITVLVSAGDSGAAGCDASSANTATHRAGVSGLCSTPYNVCVGGTEFNDSSNASTYWAPGSDPTAKSSALSYIPEMVWNESGTVPGGSELWAGGGGVSTVYTKPAWQAGPGVPADGMRDVPDVSMTAAGHDGYLIYQNGGLGAVGGTSAATPSLASLMALAVQKTGGRLGNPNSVLYAMATSQASGGAAAFHDTTLGNNSVPGVTGFSAGVGYDLATGVGSVDAAQLINNWGGPSGPSLQVSVSQQSVVLADGASAGVTVTVGVAGGFSSAVTLSATGLPSGVTAAFSTATLAAPGSGTSTLTFSAGAQAAAGSYPVQVTATGGTSTQNASLTLTVTAAGSFALSLNSSAVSVKQGGSGSLQATVTAASGFSAPVALSVLGLPSGVTATATPASFAAPGSGSSTLLLNAGVQTAPGTYPIAVMATGGGITQNASFALTVAPSGGFTLGLSAASVSVQPGGNGSVQETVTISGGFSAAVTLTISSAPVGIVVSPGYAVLAAPGGGTNTLSLSAPSQAAPGSYPVQVTAAGGGVTQTASFTVIVAQPGSFSLSLSSGTVTAKQGGSGAVQAGVTLSGGFSAPVALAIAGLPAGVTAAASPAVLAAPGSGTSTLTFNASSQTAAGVYPLQVSASGAGLTQSQVLILTVAPQAGFVLASNASSMTVVQGATVTAGITVSTSGGFNSKITLAASGQPSGMTVTLSPAVFAAPGSGSTILTVSANPQTAPGAYTIAITASGGGLTGTLPMSVAVVVPPSFSIGQSASSATLVQGGSAMESVVVNGSNGFNSAVALSASGLPSGVTATFSPAAFTGSGVSVLTLRASASAATGSRVITISAAGGGLTKSITLMLSVTVPPNFTLSESPTAATVARGSSTTFNFTLTESAGFTAPVTLTVSGMPAGVGVSFSPVGNPAPGVYSLTIKLTAASIAKVGSTTLTLTATGAGITHSTTFGLTVK